MYVKFEHPEIERGRYRGLQVEYRICNLCKAGVEDEIHFLLCCPVLQTTRSIFIQKINDEYPNFKTLDTQQKFIWLMPSEDSCLMQSVSSLLHNLNEQRNKILSAK